MSHKSHVLGTKFMPVNCLGHTVTFIVDAGQDSGESLGVKLKKKEAL